MEYTDHPNILNVIPPAATQYEGEITSVSVLTDGRGFLERLVRRIDAATKSIAINMFIWRDDPAGNRVGQAILDAASRGVDIVITKDKLGALFELGEENRQSFLHKNYDLITALKQRVINAYSSSPDLLSWVVQQPNVLVEELRHHSNVTIFDRAMRNDHSKFIVIDEEILFVGGMNFEERNVTRDANGLVWRDYVFECVDRAIVAKLKGRLAGDLPGDSSFEFILNDNAEDRRFEVKSCVIGLIGSAEKSCHIEMAYFCDSHVRDSVVAAAARGVDVQILIPAWANIQNERNLRTMREIFERTQGRASIYLSPDMLHSKMMDIDGRTIIAGSTNFNERALNKFSELNVLMSGSAPCADQIRRTFAERRDLSKRVTSLDELNYRKIKERCEYIFG